MVLFSKAKKVPKNAFLRIALRSVRGKAGSPALRLRSFCTDFLSVPDCTTTVLLQFLQNVALPIHFTQSLYCLPLSLSQTDDSSLLSIYPAAAGNLAHTGRFALPTFVKGVGFEKGRGIPLPFSVFLVPFVTVQKERPFLFPLEEKHPFLSLRRGTASFLLPKARRSDGTFPQRRKRVRCFRGTRKSALSNRAAMRTGQSRWQPPFFF